MMDPVLPPNSPSIATPIRLDDLPLAMNQRVSLLLDQGLQIVGTLTGLTPDPRTMPATFGMGGPRGPYCFDIIKLSGVEILGPGGVVLESHPEFTFINRSCGSVYQLPALPQAPMPVTVVGPVVEMAGEHEVSTEHPVHTAVARIATYVAVLTADAGDAGRGEEVARSMAELYGADGYGSSEDEEDEEIIVVDSEGPGGMVPAYGGPPVMEETVYVDDAGPSSNTPVGRDWYGYDAGVSKLQALLGDHVSAAKPTTLQEAEQQGLKDKSNVGGPTGDMQNSRHQLMLNTVKCLPTSEMLDAHVEMGMAPALFGYERVLDTLSNSCQGDPACAQILDLIGGLSEIMRSRARDASMVRPYPINTPVPVATDMVGEV